MAIYFANENGDWWSADPDGESVIYILDTDKLGPTALAEITETYGEATIEEIMENGDKLERIIQTYGKDIVLDKDSE